MKDPIGVWLFDIRVSIGFAAVEACEAFAKLEGEEGINRSYYVSWYYFRPPKQCTALGLVQSYTSFNLHRKRLCVNMRGREFVGE